MEDLPYSQASENNKQPILEILRRHLTGPGSLLEIGGGTGQHAVHFAEALPELSWQSSDVPANVPSLNLRIARAALPNLPVAIALDVTDEPWRCARFDCVYTANSLHIMSAECVIRLFASLPGHLNPGARLCVYGPFKYAGDFTSESNSHFDLWLKERDPVSGIRDFEWVDQLAQSAGLRLLEDNAMPANNQLLVWQAS